MVTLRLGYYFGRRGLPRVSNTSPVSRFLEPRTVSVRAGFVSCAPPGYVDQDRHESTAVCG